MRHKDSLPHLHDISEPPDLGAPMEAPWRLLGGSLDPNDKLLPYLDRFKSTIFPSTFSLSFPSNSEELQHSCLGASASISWFCACFMYCIALIGRPWDLFLKIEGTPKRPRLARLHASGLSSHRPIFPAYFPHQQRSFNTQLQRDVNIWRLCALVTALQTLQLQVMTSDFIRVPPGPATTQSLGTQSSYFVLAKGTCQFH
jgi:hypothetical protein